MASCDMCGQANAQVRALIERVEMDVCRDCARFGKVLREPEMHPKPQVQEQVVTDRVIPEAAALIKEKREHLKLTQEELALKLAERVSVLNKIESGKALPTIPLAKKLEQFFHIKLIEKPTEETVEKPAQQGQFTIGDILRKKYA